MNPEGDFATAGRELRARKNPNYEAACFHAQQCAEKYMKAILQEQSIPFGRTGPKMAATVHCPMRRFHGLPCHGVIVVTHNLIALLDLLLPHAGAWEDARPHLEILNVYAVAVRYPGESADKPSAREAVRHATAVRTTARRSLSLPA